MLKQPDGSLRSDAWLGCLVGVVVDTVLTDLPGADKDGVTRPELDVLLTRARPRCRRF